MKTSSFFNRYKEIVLGVLMLALGSFYLYEAAFIRTRSSVRVSAKLIPEILGVMVLVLGVLQLIAGIRYLLRVRAENAASGTATSFLSFGERRDILPILLTFVLIVAYALAFEPLGFVISSALCMFCQMLILAPNGRRRPAVFAVISVVTALVVYFAFRKGLSLSLPQAPEALAFLGI